MAMTATPYLVDRYVIDTLLPDLVGHDRSTSAFLVYLVILTAAAETGRVAFSHAQLAERTGMSRRAVQAAVARLSRRQLIEITRRGATETSQYRPLPACPLARRALGQGT